jgi:hypothetical protein
MVLVLLSTADKKELIDLVTSESKLGCLSLDEVQISCSCVDADAGSAFMFYVSGWRVGTLE